MKLRSEFLNCLLLILFFQNIEASPVINTDPPPQNDITCSCSCSANSSALGNEIVTRMEWLAQPPTEPVAKLNLPIKYVLIHHTATANCSETPQCIYQVRKIQTYHIESLHWWDIGYNFVIGGDGKAYEGRGWKSEGAHSFGYNKKSLGIAFIGTFQKIVPPPQQIMAFKKLIKRGVQLGNISPDYKLLAQRQIHVTTQSPGEALYEEMKSWDHWEKITN